ncbi:DNA glycosylase [Schizothecium vesticola]|uniref:DNA glycosylase n=1 Tax=Schizothecium vesticola TaxID=314040 RepID=A0AA40FA62_9PEZI|nr:DNA glycosylase [Schizothecium vesticola]
MECATALENKAPDPEWGLLGHLGSLCGNTINEQREPPKSTRHKPNKSTATPKRKPPNRTVSHFWDDPSGTETAAPLPPSRGTTLPLIPPAHFHTSVPRPQPPTSPIHPTQSPATTTSKNPTTSPFFTIPRPPPKPRPPRGTLSSLPIPPLSAPRFGLIQESLASDPFSLLIAVTFLIRTKAVVAIPYFHALTARFPGPEALAAADPEEVVEMIRPLGLSRVRCGVMKRLARGWIERPPERGRRYTVRGYAEGVGVREGEEFGADDEGGEVVGAAWEIGHLVKGAYALDSWRIFCRDVLLGRARGWNGEGREEGFQPEWMRVVPKDKELRACLRWMWMREGWWWDAETGEREVLREEMRRAVEEGRVGYDDHGRLVILEGALGVGHGGGVEG